MFSLIRFFRSIAGSLVGVEDIAGAASLAFVLLGAALAVFEAAARALGSVGGKVEPRLADLAGRCG